METREALTAFGNFLAWVDWHRSEREGCWFCVRFCVCVLERFDDGCVEFVFLGVVVLDAFLKRLLFCGH